MEVFTVLFASLLSPIPTHSPRLSSRSFRKIYQKSLLKEPSMRFSLTLLLLIWILPIPYVSSIQYSFGKVFDWHDFDEDELNGKVESE